MAKSVVNSREMVDRLERHNAWMEAGFPQTKPLVSDWLIVTDARIEQVELANLSLDSVRLIRCDLSGSTFRDCNLSAVMLTECDLRHTRFVGCEFFKAQLMNSDARQASFTGSSLVRADLSNADLRHVDLTGCDLGWAWLIETDLRSANLEDVKLDGTRFVETRFSAGRQFTMAVTERTMVEDVRFDEDTSPVSGVAALDRIRRRS